MSIADFFFLFSFFPLEIFPILGVEKSGWSPPSIAGRNRLTHFSFYFSGRVFAPPRSHASHTLTSICCNGNIHTRCSRPPVSWPHKLLRCERSREAVLWCCGSMVRCHTKHVKSRRGCAVNEEPTRGGKKGWKFFFQSTPDSDLDSRQKFPPHRTTDREQISSGKKEKRKLSPMQWTRPNATLNH